MVGTPSTTRITRPHGRTSPTTSSASSCVNDWSARDIQAWEYVPLGPFLGKSFATSISPWVVPLDALAAARSPLPCAGPRRCSTTCATTTRGASTCDCRSRLNGSVVSPSHPFATQYWSPGQQLAHLTVNGASLRTGDLFASGTVTGPERHQRGSLLELSWGGREPFTLDDGTDRTFLEDGDTVTISGWAPGPDGRRIGLGEVTGTIRPARAASATGRAGLTPLTTHSVKNASSEPPRDVARPAG